MNPEATRVHEQEVDGGRKLYCIVSYEHHDLSPGACWDWDAVSFGGKGAVILAVWDQRNSCWISFDAFPFESVLRLTKHAGSRIDWFVG